MRVAIFVDVDKTITREIIQREFARELKCEAAYLDIETQFQNKEIKSEVFGERIIKLFNEHGFDLDAAERIFPRIELQPWANELLKLSVDRYFVSSGPSYYIELLARRYQIAEANICCSKYLFDRQTRRLKECIAVNHQHKMQFVQERVGKYDITVGIGDDPVFDQFVNLCTIPLLTVETDNFIYVPNFSLAVPMIRKIATLADGIAASIEAAGTAANGKAPGAAIDVAEFKSLSPRQLLQKLSTGSWLWIAGILVAVTGASFELGIWVMRSYPALFPAGTH